MKSILAKYATWKFILPPFVCGLICICLFQTYQAQMSTLAGEKVVLIDLQSSYTMTEITNFFTKIKEEGRGIHKHATGVVDMIFPFTYGPFFILLTAFFLKKLTRPDSNWMYVSLFPVLLMIIDFKENFNTLRLLKIFPNLTNEIVDSAARVTDLKAMIGNLSFGLPVVLAFILLVKLILNRLRNS